MEIEIVWGAGEGPTGLSAFDAALAAAGIHNYNLVPLSSIIPPDATLAETGMHEPSWPVGSLIGTVMASNRSSTPGDTISAGLGWTLADRGGVFFEEHGESVEHVEHQIKRGLNAAREHRPAWAWESNIETRAIEHRVEANGAVVVAALYRAI